ncbi:restriction endonuclease [Actinocorallia libanotica]|uniref:Restriction endonuclease type IV Mrr domain-containing protein n=1 Tax=Actinocorallia libanotica TaxID=46162 RepID=A0ABN1REZ7_9ACTN
MLIPEPERRPVDDWKTAEHNAAAWMRHWGFTDATVTPAGADGGIDIRSRKALGQVKFQGAAVGRAELQRLVGARMRGEQQLFFFTGSAYSAPALAYGEAMDIALFQYDPWGRMKAANKPASAVIASAKRERKSAQPSTPLRIKLTVNKPAAAVPASAERERKSAQPSTPLHKIKLTAKEERAYSLGCGTVSFGCGSFLVTGAIIALVQTSEDRLLNTVILVVGVYFLLLCYFALRQGIRPSQSPSPASQDAESVGQGEN